MYVIIYIKYLFIHLGYHIYIYELIYLVETTWFVFFVQKNCRFVFGPGLWENIWKWRPKRQRIFGGFLEVPPPEMY